MKAFLMAAVAAATLVPMAANAAANLTAMVQSDTINLSAQTESNIVGQTSTATTTGGGNPIYTATGPQYSGVVALIMDEGAAGRFICSGSLMADRMSVLTAGHCVSHGAGTANPVSTTAYFYNGGDPNAVVPGNPASAAIAVNRYFVDSQYTGEVIDNNDIAVLRLSQAAPDWATSYGLYSSNPLGDTYNVAGYGNRSDAGGSVGADLGNGRLRQGNNTYDFQLGDAAFGGFFDGTSVGGQGFFGAADNSQVLVADFDNGTATNDAACRLLVDGFGELPNAQFCNTGLGALEVSTAPGDSGGPQFVDGKVASVTSFGLSFGSSFGDIDNKLNDSFGEFNGFTPVYTHLDFINGAMGAPEPATWALLIAGFGAAGSVLRRRKAVAAA